MNVLILNGSPKLGKSVTLQSMKFLELKHKDVSFKTIHLIKSMRVGDKAIQLDMKEVKKADIIIWSFPLYHLTVPGHMKGYIEKIFSLNLSSYFDNKHTSVFTTSIKYCDNIAHDYMEEICFDLKMKYMGNLSHGMNDFLIDKYRNELAFYFGNLLDDFKNKIHYNSKVKKVKHMEYNYNVSGIKNNKTDNKLVIVTDSSYNTGVNGMIQEIKYLASHAVVIDINQRFHYCIGCCKCGPQNICVFNDKDNYRKTLDSILSYDIILFAGDIVDRYLSSNFKTYFDRSFCYTHIPKLRYKQIGFLISGNYANTRSLQQVFNTYGSQGNFLGVVSDESRDDLMIRNDIIDMLRLAKKYAAVSYKKSETFAEQAPLNHFKEEISGSLGILFKMDYNYYKKNGYLKKVDMSSKVRCSVLRWLIGFKKVREVMYKDIYSSMISKHIKVLEKLHVETKRYLREK